MTGVRLPKWGLLVGVAVLVGLLVSVQSVSAQSTPDFDDVPDGHIAESAIEWAAENGITQGVGNNRFGMGQTLTRYEMVTFLCRAFNPGNCQSGAKGSDRFDDVPEGHWANYSVGWAANQQITSGVSTIEFGGSQTLTREQMITFLYRAEGKPTGGTLGSVVYEDVPDDPTHWANPPIEWAYDQGVTGGIAVGTFGFGTNVSREEMVLFLCRTLAPGTCPPSQQPLSSSVVPTTTTTATQTDSEVDDELVLEVRIAAESHGGVAYDRDLYGSWTLVRSGCNTRCAVLEEEQLADGTWYSWYDGLTITNSSDLDIDHMVPLAEAHSSGGWQWDSTRKSEYANDITHPEALTAVSASSNRSKGSRDPAEWKPPAEDAWCDYAIDWITVKTAWNLTSDENETEALEEMLDTCDQTVTLNMVTATTPTVSPPAGRWELEVPSSRLLPIRVRATLILPVDYAGFRVTIVMGNNSPVEVTVSSQGHASVRGVLNQDDADGNTVNIVVTSVKDAQGSPVSFTIPDAAIAGYSHDHCARNRVSGGCDRRFRPSYYPTHWHPNEVPRHRSGEHEVD